MILHAAMKHYSLKLQICHPSLNLVWVLPYQSFLKMLSEEEIVTCGIPQGSILGLLLFLVCIHDLTSSLEHSKDRIYVDETNFT